LFLPRASFAIVAHTSGDFYFIALRFSNAFGSLGMRVASIIKFIERNVRLRE
jgi:hypothetical protein